VVEPIAVLGMHPNWYLWAWCRLRTRPGVSGWIASPAPSCSTSGRPIAPDPSQVEIPT
jgi:hypothetical protein